MNKRLVVKTALISFGIFILILSIAAYFFLQNYEPVNENTYRVLVAKTDIEVGTEIGMQMVEYRAIRVSGLNKYMLLDTGDVIGRKAINKTAAGDYIRSYDLLPPGQWHAADERAIVLAMDMEDRLGNLIKNGSFVDIKVLFNNIKAVPQTVLSKVSVKNLIDENGMSLNSTNQNAKKVYAEFCLNEEQRNKIYAAKKMGKLIYELHLDPIQPKIDEEFIIPQEFLSHSGMLSEPDIPSLDNKQNQDIFKSGVADKNSVSEFSANDSSSSSLVINSPAANEDVHGNPSSANQQTGHMLDTLPSTDPTPTYRVKGIPGYN